MFRTRMVVHSGLTDVWLRPDSIMLIQTREDGMSNVHLISGFILTLDMPATKLADQVKSTGRFFRRK